MHVRYVIIASAICVTLLDLLHAGCWSGKSQTRLSSCMMPYGGQMTVTHLPECLAGASDFGGNEMSLGTQV